MDTSPSSFAVLWDVDGTLVDTAELHYQSWCVLAAELGGTYSRADFNDTFGWRNPEIIPKIFGAHYSEREVLDLGDRKEAYYRAEAKKGVALLPGVRALIEALAALGVRQAIGSSAPRANVDLIVDMAGIGQYLAGIVAMEDVARGKPNPEVFTRGAALLGVEAKNCVVIEDAPVGIQAAKAGGMGAVAVTYVNHHPAEKLRAAGADRIVDSLESITAEEVIDIVRRG